MKKSTKQIEELTNGRKKSTAIKVKKEAELTPEQLNVLTLWESEVTLLLSRRFKDFDEAVEAVIEGVVNRMERDKSQRERTRDFLYTFMTTDDSMVRELKAIFNLP